MKFYFRDFSGNRISHFGSRNFYVTIIAWKYINDAYPGFLPQTKNMHIRRTGDSKLPLGVS